MVVPIRDAGAIANWLNQLAENGDFLERQNKEAAEAAIRLASHEHSRVTLAATLVKTFRHHRSGKPSESI
jgi:hypothetical protein